MTNTSVQLINSIADKILLSTTIQRWYEGSLNNFGPIATFIWIGLIAFSVYFILYLLLLLPYFKRKAFVLDKWGRIYLAVVVVLGVTLAWFLFKYTLSITTEMQNL